jgi:hypothetical protein
MDAGLAHRDNVMHVRRRVAAEFAVGAAFRANPPYNRLIAFEVVDRHANRLPRQTS